MNRSIQVTCYLFEHLTLLIIRRPQSQMVQSKRKRAQTKHHHSNLLSILPIDMWQSQRKPIPQSIIHISIDIIMHLHIFYAQFLFWYAHKCTLIPSSTATIIICVAKQNGDAMWWFIKWHLVCSTVELQRAFREDGRQGILLQGI